MNQGSEAIIHWFSRNLVLEPRFCAIRALFAWSWGTLAMRIRVTELALQ